MTDVLFKRTLYDKWNNLTISMDHTPTPGLVGFVLQRVGSEDADGEVEREGDRPLRSVGDSRRDDVPAHARRRRDREGEGVHGVAGDVLAPATACGLRLGPHRNTNLAIAQSRPNMHSIPAVEMVAVEVDF